MLNAIVAIAAARALGSPTIPDPNVIPKETKTEHNARMRWWREARFGMFIHWGLYAIPAGKWNGETGHAEWIRETAHIPVHEYEKFQKQFDPVKFDPDLWAKMAKDAGMKYVVITTKHHDGFNMFFSKYTDWSVEHTPYHKDVARMLANAVRKQGLTMGFYHSIMDWHHPDYLPRRSWEVADRPADGADFDRFNRYLRNDVRQILTEYGPIGVIWFDGEWENTWNANYGDSLYALCRTVAPNVIVNNRVSVGRAGGDDSTVLAGDYGTPEQSIPATGLPGQDWETCMTMNDHWGYNAADKNWKSSKVLLHNLIDIASKGGNYLLNIGPRADGTFPPEAVDRLHDMGQWMHVNGESIYGTTASVFDKLPWGRSTTKAMGKHTRLYLQVFDWPKDGKLVVPSIGNRPVAARLLGSSEPIAFRREESDLVLTLPAKPVNSVASVVALDVSGTPVIYRTPTIQAETHLVVRGTQVSINPPPSQLQVRYTLDGTPPNSKSMAYVHPFTVSKACVLTAATFSGPKRVSANVVESFAKASLVPALKPDPFLEPGLLLKTYSGSWSKLPDFSHLTPTSTQSATSLSVPMDGKKPLENVGERYTGYLRIPADEVYVFSLVSDDGSRLLIDGDVVVDNDGSHAASVKKGEVALAKGLHRITLDYFNGAGDASLALSYKTPGQNWKTVSGAMFAQD